MKRFALWTALFSVAFLAACSSMPAQSGTSQGPPSTGTPALSQTSDQGMAGQPETGPGSVNPADQWSLSESRIQNSPSNWGFWPGAGSAGGN